MSTHSINVIFIVGNSRSGTTMLGRILGKNSLVHTFGELHFFEHQIDSSTMSSKEEFGCARAETLIERLLTSSRDGFFSNTIPKKYISDVRVIINGSESKHPISLYSHFLLHETLRNGKQIPCEQTPRYLFFVADIFRSFPSSRVINIIRDPRDVLSSQKNKWKRRSLGAKSIPFKESLRAWVNYHPVLIAKLWLSSVRQAKSFQGNSRFLSVKFEDLLENPEVCIRDVSNFVGIDYELEMLKVPNVGSSYAMDQPNRLGIDKRRANAWHHGGLTKREIQICEWVAGDEMKAHGYSLVGNGQFSIAMIPSIFGLLLKLTLIVPMNFSRTKSIRDTIVRRVFGEKVT